MIKQTHELFFWFNEIRKIVYLVTNNKNRNAEACKLSNVEGVRDPGSVELGPSELQDARQEHWAGLLRASDG